MSQGMLGTLRLSEVRGPMGDLEERLAGPNGRAWLTSFRRYLRRERDPFAELAPGEEPRSVFERWRPVDAVTVEVNLAAELSRWPGCGNVEWRTPGQTEGWVRVHRDGDTLLVDDREIRRHLLPEQSDGQSCVGTMDFRRRIAALDPVHPNILSALYENLHLIPVEAWTRDAGGQYQNFVSWSHGFVDSYGNPVLRSLHHFRGAWERRVDRIDRPFDRLRPALVLASSSGPS